MHTCREKPQRVNIRALIFMSFVRLETGSMLQGRALLLLVHVDCSVHFSLIITQSSYIYWPARFHSCQAVWGEKKTARGSDTYSKEGFLPLTLGNNSRNVRAPPFGDSLLPRQPQWGKARAHPTSLTGSGRDDALSV